MKGLAWLPQTLNPYPCSVNNPLRYPDPSGTLGEGLAEGAPGAGAGGGDYYLNARARKLAGELPGTGGLGGEPCEGAGPGGTWEQYGMDWWNHFKDTNEAIFGLTAPTGVSLATGQYTAGRLGVPSLLKWARSGFAGAMIEGVAYSEVEMGIFASGAAALNGAIWAGGYEAGVATGSAVSAMPAYGEPCTNIAEWWGNYLYEHEDDALRSAEETLLRAK